MKRLVSLTVMLLMAIGASIGWAAWSAQSVGAATGRGYQLPAGAVPTTSASTASVTLNWTQVTLAGSRIGTLPGGGYLVRRYANGTSTPITPGAGCAGLITGVGATISCTETAVPDGNWQYAVTPAVGSWRGVQSAKSAAIQTDATAPIVTLTSPLNGAATNSATPGLSGTAGVAPGDLATITVKIYNGAGIAGTIAQTLTTTQSGGSWAVSAAALPQGTYTAQAQQTDTAGNTGTSGANTFIIDTTAPPLPTINSAPVSPSNSPNATFTFSDSEAGVSFLCRVDSLPFSPCSSPTTFAAVTAGAHTFQLRAQDAAGNTTGSASTSWTIDLTAPTVTLSTPANGTLTNQQTPTITGTASTASGDASTVTVSIYNGASVTGSPAQQRTATVTAGAWSTVPSTPLTSGTYTIQAQQTDTAGNTGTSTANTITIDTTAPIVTLTAPANGSATNSQTPALTGTAGTATGDSTTVTVRIYSGSGTAGTLLQTLTPTRTGGTWTTVPTTLAQGTYTAQATQTDTAGNIGTSTANTFTIDTTPPTVTLASCPVTGPNGNRVVTPTGTASTATGDNQTITITIYNGSGTAGTTFQTLTTTATAGAWTATSNKLTHGNNYTIRAAQTDSAANTGLTTTCTFTA
jgi:hypothetical protein